MGVKAVFRSLLRVPFRDVAQLAAEATVHTDLGESKGSWRLISNPAFPA